MVKTRFISFVILILFVMITKPGIHAQEGSQLKIVFDYKSSLSCRTTAYNELGVKVIPCSASIKPIKYGLYEVVRKDSLGREKFGIYDYEGNVILPVEFDFLGTWPDKLSDELLIYGMKGKKGYFDTRRGAIHLLSRKRLPLGKKIEQWPDSRSMEINPHTYFHVRTEDSSFVFNHKFELFFSTDKNLVGSFICYCQGGFSNEPLWEYSENKLNKVGLLTNDNSIVFPDKFDNFRYDCFKVKGNFPIIAKKGENWDLFYDLHVDSVMHFKYIFTENTQKEGLIGKTMKNEWQLLDSNLNVVYSNKEYGINRISYPFDHSVYLEDYFFHETNTTGADFAIGSLDLADSVLFTINFGKFDIKNYEYSGKQDVVKPPKYGLVNYVTGKSVPVEYSDAIPRRQYTVVDYVHSDLSPPVSYWMVKESEHMNIITIDVYDAQLNLKNSFKLSDSSLFFLRSYKFQNDTLCWPLINEHDQIEIFRNDGSVVGEYKFTRRLLITNPYFNAFVLEFNGKYGFFDRYGKELSPLQYDTIKPLRENYLQEIVGIRNGIIDIFDNNGKLLLDSISEIWFTDNFSNYRSWTTPYVIIKNGYAYGAGMEKIELITPERMGGFKNKRLYIREKGVYIDETGKVIQI